jgi:hypothetical protein
LNSKKKVANQGITTLDRSMKKNIMTYKGWSVSGGSCVYSYRPAFAIIYIVDTTVVRIIGKRVIHLNTP